MQLLTGNTESILCLLLKGLSGSTVERCSCCFFLSSAEVLEGEKAGLLLDAPLSGKRPRLQVNTYFTHRTASSKTCKHR